MNTDNSNYIEVDEDYFDMEFTRKYDKITIPISSMKETKETTENISANDITNDTSPSKQSINTNIVKEDACANQIKMCKLNFHPCCYCGNERNCPNHSVICGGNNVPSFSQWCNVYEVKAFERHSQNGQLSKERIRSVISTLKQFVKVMNYSMEDKVTLITRKSIQEFLNRLTGLREISKKAKAQSIQSCFSRWIRFAVEDEWDVPKFDLPELKDDSERFQAPSPEQMVKLGVWFRSLIGRGNGHRKGRDRLFVALMLHYDLRNSDVIRMKWSNIKIVDGKPRLEYVPHKTRLSSKRKVKIWMDMLDYHDFIEYRERLKKYGYPCGDNDFIMLGGKCIEQQSRLCKEIKSLGFTGFKKLYLCRKICTNAAVMEGGKEYAEAISGDEYKTISVHYSDISSYNTVVPKSLCF